MTKISELFVVKYGVNLELNSLKHCKKGDKNSVNFVSRTSKNNGITAVVEKIAGLTPIPAGTISVAAGGSVLETFLQPQPYYSGRDLFYLTPRIKMSDKVKLLYCAFIRANKYKYNYGRQANKTLGDIVIPDLDEVVVKAKNLTLNNFCGLKRSVLNENIKLNVSTWKDFSYREIFIIKRGDSVYLQDLPQGNIPYVSATSENNGISGYIDRYNTEGNCIVLNYDGSIGEAFYHEKPFFASEKVVTISLRHHVLNKYIAIFLITLIRKEKYRYNYGLKWSVNSRMLSSTIKLPVSKTGCPDWDFMEKYIKSLPYSTSI